MRFCVFCFVLMTSALEAVSRSPWKVRSAFSLLAIHMVSSKCTSCPFPSGFEAALFADFSSPLCMIVVSLFYSLEKLEFHKTLGFSCHVFAIYHHPKIWVSKKCVWIFQPFAWWYNVRHLMPREIFSPAALDSFQLRFSVYCFLSQSSFCISEHENKHACDMFI